MEEEKMLPVDPKKILLPPKILVPAPKQFLLAPEHFSHPPKKILLTPKNFSLVQKFLPACKIVRGHGSWFHGVDLQTVIFPEEALLKVTPI